ncbi:redoxin domain-containing protein [Fibrella arboris]|uniref:redoxin domain-containing protein n=1 Tax=Fibrella arboris TaxID=3242486 RepID=UPI003520A853
MSQLKAGQAAPHFSTLDVNGKPISLSDYVGKTVWLIFHRNVGCPICNLRFYELEKHQAELQANGIVVLSVYESSAANMRQYLDGRPQPYSRMIPDPTEQLYRLYGVERSFGKLLSGVMLHGGIGKLKASKKLTAKLPKQDGHADRMGAELLIGPDGRICRAHYHRFLGDDLPLTEIRDAGKVFS